MIIGTGQIASPDNISINISINLKFKEARALRRYFANGKDGSALDAECIGAANRMHDIMARIIEQMQKEFYVAETEISE